MPTITFQPLGQSFAVAAGTTILDVAMQNNIFLRHVCGGKAMCTTCRCKVLQGADGLSPKARSEEKRLREMYAPKEARLSCQAEIRGDVVVEIPVPTLGV
ncbi:MAG TPA: 2Fe-2S iron-sulfur cluster-binding protein [Symbiobacteriaceae bacterium]|nr:2Fe-2S iron-sulfur cluster-binding protein [Symbiobacteriaceae bacterium]